MEQEVHQLRIGAFSTVEAVTPGGAVIRMLRLHLHTYVDRPGQPHQRVELPGVAMTLEVALDLALAIQSQVRAMQQQEPDRTPPAGSALN